MKAKDIAQKMKAEKRWTGKSKEQRVHALKKTGSWTDDHKKSLRAMGGSQADTLVDEMKAERKQAYLKRVHSK